MASRSHAACPPRSMDELPEGVHCPYMTHTVRIRLRTHARACVGYTFYFGTSLKLSEAVVAYCTLGGRCRPRLSSVIMPV